MYTFDITEILSDLIQSWFTALIAVCMFVLGAMTYRMHRKNAELTRELTLSRNAAVDDLETRKVAAKIIPVLEEMVVDCASVGAWSKQEDILASTEKLKLLLNEVRPQPRLAEFVQRFNDVIFTAETLYFHEPETESDLMNRREIMETCSELIGDLSEFIGVKSIPMMIPMPDDSKFGEFLVNRGGYRKL